MSAPRVTAAPDAQWFAVALTVPAGRLPDGFWDELAAAFAEDPEKVGEALLELHALNEQTASDLHNGDDELAEHSGAQADDARETVAALLPVDVTVRMNEDDARSLAEAALFAARKAFSARTRAGHDPLRKATPLRSVA